MKYLVKLSPEITIKSKPVRKRCIKLLQNNIKKHFNYIWVTINVLGNWDIIVVEYNKCINKEEEFSLNQQIKETLSCIPWIAHFMEVISFSIEHCISQEEIFDTIYQETQKIHLQNVEWKSFVVRVKRTGLHNFTSSELERYIWWGLLKFWNNNRVDLHHPDYTVKVELRDKNFHVIKHKISGVNGYPIWFQEKIVSLISGWFDSGVSTYAMMKRGCEVDYLFFNLWWTAHELWVKQISYYLWKKFSIPHKKARFITVPFEEVISELLTKVHHKFRGIILKRYMLQIASRIAENNYLAVVKWDSLWQVSSQTLKNMHVIDKASDVLVLRPLIADNKQEIIDISQKIWTYNFSCNMPEYCWIVSDKPSTGAKLENIIEEEKNIDFSVLDSAFMKRKIVFVNDMLEGDFIPSESGKIDVISELWDDTIIIDIREKDIISKKPLIWYENIVEIPFFEINHKFWKLDHSKEYGFYCEKWVLSELHWLYLQEKWFNNIKIFRPNKQK